MKKPERINSLLRIREYTAKLFDKKFMQKLILSSARTMKLSSHFRNGSNKVAYDGNLYVENYKKCFSGCFKDGRPHFVFTNACSLPPRERFYDIIRYQCPCINLFNTEGLQYGIYNEKIYALTSVSSLHIYSVKSNSWIKIKDIYLGSCYHFKHIMWDEPMERFVLQSKQFPSEMDRDIIFYFAIFDVAPFKFICLFEIKISTFGKVVDASISKGILNIGLKKSVILYDMNDIVNELVERTVGDHFEGLPVNVIINYRPQPLQEIECKRLCDLSFGGYPWMCLIQEQDFVKCFKIADKSKVAVINKYDKTLCDETLSDMLDDRPVYFHEDNSGRIVHVKSNCVGIFTVHSDSNDELVLADEFFIKVRTKKVNENVLQKRSRSGRTIKPMDYLSNYIELKSEVIHSIDYCSDSNLLALLYLNSCSSLEKYVVGIYDNENGKLLKEFTIDVPVADGNEWTVYLNHLTVICILHFVDITTNTMFIFTLKENT